MKKRDILVARLKAKQKIRKVIEQRQVKNASYNQPVPNQQSQPPAPYQPNGLGGNNGLTQQP
jgi:hypothetical protein